MTLKALQDLAAKAVDLDKAEDEAVDHVNALGNEELLDLDEDLNCGKDLLFKTASGVTVKVNSYVKTRAAEVRAHQRQLAAKAQAEESRRKLQKAMDLQMALEQHEAEHRANQTQHRNADLPDWGTFT